MVPYDKGFNIYDSIDWEGIGKDKDKYKDVLEGFEQHFKPCQTAIHSWYQLGSMLFQSVQESNRIHAKAQRHCQSYWV